MRGKILSFLSAIMDRSWAKPLTALIRESHTKLLSDQPGQYQAGNLLAELKIRSNSSENTGIVSIGMIETQSALATLNRNQVILNYIFKGEEQTGIVYLDEKAERIIGAILIKTAQSENVDKIV